MLALCRGERDVGEHFIILTGKNELMANLQCFGIKSAVGSLEPLQMHYFKMQFRTKLHYLLRAIRKKIN